jgi:hypothetical protein
MSRAAASLFGVRLARCRARMKPPRLLQLFRFGTDILGKLPGKGDGVVQILVKALALADSYEKTFARKTTVYQDIFDRYDLREKRSEAFVRLFFDTDLCHDGFTLRRQGASDHVELIEAVSLDGERLFFQEMRYGKPEIANDFFHTPRFDFAKALRSIWKRYPHGIYLSSRPSRSGYGRESTFCAIPDVAYDLTAPAMDRIVNAIAAHSARKGQAWCTILYGPPGTGKTAHVNGFAFLSGKRLLKIDASALPQLGPLELSFLVDALKPQVLLIDDFDRAPIDDTRSRVLYLFEHVKQEHAGLATFITVNRSDGLDPALLRSQRIDDAEEFPVLTAQERIEVIGRIKKAALRALFQEADAQQRFAGFNHADFMAAVNRCNDDERFDDVMGSIQRLRALAEAAEAAATKSGAAPDGAPKAPT